MVSLKKSSKEMQIDKANASIVLFVSLAAIVMAFSMVSIKSLLAQKAYQSKVITQQEAALKIAKADLQAVSKLSASYSNFDSKTPNIIGGNSTGTGAQDGSNSKIVLDALPSVYDFPALVTSLEKLVTDRGFKGGAVSGTDDPALGVNASTPSPVATEIPFNLSVTGSYNSVKDLVNVLQKSIRPIKINTMQLSGSDTGLTLSLGAKTYYQQAKNLNITTKVIE